MIRIALSLVLISSTFFIANKAFALSSPHCVFGCPNGTPSSNDIVSRPIYILSNNRTTKFADWIAYKVTRSTIDGPSRSRNFRADPALNSRHTLETNDYDRANALIGTDRGHQVPLASFSNTPYHADTNYLSNITPQASGLNQGPWRFLEEAVRNLARTGVDVYVFTGPLYEFFFAELPRANERHTIPSGYWKTIVTVRNGWIRTTSFIMNQTTSRRSSYCSFQTTADVVEFRAGIDLMRQLRNDIEALVESGSAPLRRELGC